MRIFARAITALIGLLLLVMGLRWVSFPAAAAAGLHLELPDDPFARSTLIGDFSAFFLGAAAMCIIGTLSRQANWIRACALLLGGAALFRLVAFMIHDAGLPYELIAVEIVCTALLVWVAPMVHHDRRRGAARNDIYESEV